MSPPRSFRKKLLSGVLAVLLVLVGVADASQSNTIQEEPDIGLRLLFKFETEEAREAGVLLSEAGLVEFVIEEFSVAAIRVRSLDVLVDLLTINGISLAEVDGNRTALPYYYDANDSKQISDEDSRRLSEEQQPYGIAMVQADQLWSIQPVGDVDVCVVDTGIDDGHEDLPNSVDNGVDGTDTFPAPILFGTWDVDGNGHGTHCAGIIGARGGNNIGVVGVKRDPNTFRFHIGKGLSNQGGGFTSTILEAVDGCVQAGTKVISMSLGGNVFSQIENDYYNYLFSQGFLIVAAAGNDGTSAYAYPASYDAVMSVAAVDINRNRASFSQYNDQVEIAAPGVSILSTYPPNTYELLSGTSMACPYVAGVAAAVWSHFPTCTNSQIRNVLRRTAMDRGPTGYDPEYGYGIVQAKAAYDLLTSEGCEAGGAPRAAPSGGCNPNISNCSSGAAQLLGTSLFVCTSMVWFLLSVIMI